MTLAPGANSLNTSLEARPFKSVGLNSGASIGLLASMTIRPFQFGSPSSASGSFDQGTATSTMSIVQRLRGLQP